MVTNCHIVARITISLGGCGQVFCFSEGRKSTSVIVLCFLFRRGTCSGGAEPPGGLSSTIWLVVLSHHPVASRPAQRPGQNCTGWKWLTVLLKAEFGREETECLEFFDVTDDRSPVYPELSGNGLVRGVTLPGLLV